MMGIATATSKKELKVDSMSVNELLAEAIERLQKIEEIIQGLK